jgi:hypothetical protein
MRSAEEFILGLIHSDSGRVVARHEHPLDTVDQIHRLGLPQGRDGLVAI